MRNFKRLLFVLLLCCCSQLLRGQEVKFEDWGIGIVKSSDPSLPSDALTGLVVYDGPNWMPIGKFTGAGRIHLSCDQRKLDILGEDYREYEYGVAGLLFWKEEDGFIQLLSHSYEGGLWIKKTDLASHQWLAQSWMEFLTGSVTLFPERLGIRMNLRTEPKAGAQLLANLSDDRFFITTTGKSDGLWAEVEVTQYKGPYCSGDNTVVNTWKGWVKLLDDKGHPNLWFYTRGC